jgi:hypothetical protein
MHISCSAKVSLERKSIVALMLAPLAPNLLSIIFNILTAYWNSWPVVISSRLAVWLGWQPLLSSILAGLVLGTMSALTSLFNMWSVNDGSSIVACKYTSRVFSHLISLIQSSVKGALGVCPGCSLVFYSLGCFDFQWWAQLVPSALPHTAHTLILWIIDILAVVGTLIIITLIKGILQLNYSKSIYR